MKQIIAVLAMILIVVVLSISCGSTKICPAYSSSEIEQTCRDNG
jgi:hypothetical protein